MWAAATSGPWRCPSGRQHADDPRDAHSRHDGRGRDGAGAIHHGAAIAIQGDRIRAIGPSAKILAQFPNAQAMDGRNRAVMPGFADTHTHLHLTLARGIFEDMSSLNALPFDKADRLPLRRLSDEEHTVMCQLGALEAVRSGTTAVLEDNIGIARYAGQLADSGLRLLLADGRATHPRPKSASKLSAMVYQGIFQPIRAFRRAMSACGAREA
jgi:cytosine/adenosine deaminase-related metal-dependent hydrolase